MKCRYKAPWKECEQASLYRNETGHKCFEPARNDDRLNIHNPQMLVIWRENIGCQPITSQALVFKYIVKYASNTLPNMPQRLKKNT